MGSGEEMGSAKTIGEGMEGARQTTNTEGSRTTRGNPSISNFRFIFAAGAEHSMDCIST